VSKIQELEGELVRLQNLNSLKEPMRNGFLDLLESSNEDGIHSKNLYYKNFRELSSESDTKDVDINSKLLMAVLLTCQFFIYLHNA